MDVPVSRPVGLTARTTAIRHLDLVTVGAVVALTVLGLMSVLTATVDPEGKGLLQAPSELFNRQLVFCVLAGVVLLATILIDYRFFRVYAGVMYGVTLFLMIIVMTPLGETVKGSQRWISLGILNLQPSELAKPVLLATLAAYMAERKRDLTLNDVMRCIGLTTPYVLLVFLQPDFGTMLVLGAILLTMLVIGGADARHLVVLIATAAIGGVGLFQIGFVHDYQRTRLAAFLDPEGDPFLHGYNYRLTRLAVGNGGLFGSGTGLWSESQSEEKLQAPGADLGPEDRPGDLTNLDYVPEQHTDFVFTVIAEKMGFVGGSLLLLLYGIVFVRGIKGAGMARDHFGTLLATGAVGYLSFQVFVNVGMTVGLVPITGIPLPFVSYGGSSLMASALAVGVLLSVRMRRFARPMQ